MKSVEAVENTLGGLKFMEIPDEPEHEWIRSAILVLEWVLDDE